MPDITMCLGTLCPLRFKCYRFLATPTANWQLEVPYKAETENCEYFLENEK
jgi:hypothetical protein